MRDERTVVWERKQIPPWLATVARMAATGVFLALGGLLFLVPFPGKLSTRQRFPFLIPCLGAVAIGVFRTWKLRNRRPVVCLLPEGVYVKNTMINKLIPWSTIKSVQWEEGVLRVNNTPLTIIERHGRVPIGQLLLTECQRREFYQLFHVLREHYRAERSKADEATAAAPRPGVSSS